MCKRDLDRISNSLAHLSSPIDLKRELDERPIKVEETKDDSSRLVVVKTEKDAEEEKMLTPTKPSSKPISAFFGENEINIHSCIKGAAPNLCSLGICCI